MKSLVGQQITHYRIDALLGEGGMGAVYRAYDLNLARPVALKVMQRHLARQEHFQQRFAQEAQAVARLDHPSIVDVHDFGTAAGVVYMVMGYVPGASLAKHVRRLRQSGQVLKIDETLSILSQAADALGYAHRQGVIHRDIKPDNVLLKSLDRPDEVGGLPVRAVLTDFGLAKLAEGGIQTQTGTFMGTMAYMSPEQCLGEPLDGRSDVYSLGVVLYELATGRLPFDVQTPTDALRMHVHEPLPEPRSVRPGLPAGVDQIIKKALSKEPAHRFQSGEQMSQAMRQVRTGLSQADITRFAPAGTVFSLMTELQAEAGQPVPAPAMRAAERVEQERIAIVAKDGSTRFVTPEKEELTVGRTKENDIVLAAKGVSRHHARLLRTPGGWLIVDLNSTNGSFLGDSKLLPGVPEPWPPDTMLRISDHWLRLDVGAGGRPQVMVRADGTAIEAEQVRFSRGRGQIGLHLEQKELSVVAGGEVSLPLIVLNQGALVDHLALTQSGLPDEWVAIPDPVIHLMPGQQAERVITIRPPRAPQSTAGRHSFQVRVTSQSLPDEVAEEETALTVEPYYGYELTLRPQRVRSTTEGQFRLRVANQGNAAITVSPTAADAEERCWFTFQPAQLIVPPAEESETSVMIGARSGRASAEPRTHSFTVTASCKEEPTLVRQVQGIWERIAPAFDLTLHPASQSGTARAIYGVQVANLSEAEIRVRLKAEEEGGTCSCEIDPPTVKATPAGLGQARLTVRPYKAVPAVRKQQFRISVEGQVVSSPEVSRKVEGTWEYVPPHFDLSIAPPSRQSASEGQYTVQVGNSSEIELTFELEAEGDKNAITFLVQPSRLVVPAGGSRQASLVVRPRASTLELKRHTFAVVAKVSQAPALFRAAEAVWEQLPEKPKPPEPTVAEAVPVPAPPAKVPEKTPASIPEHISSPEKRPGRLGGCLLLLSGLLITLVVGWYTGFLSSGLLFDDQGAGGLICAGMVWLGGLTLTLRLAFRAWRR